MVVPLHNFSTQWLDAPAIWYNIQMSEYMQDYCIYVYMDITGTKTLQLLGIATVLLEYIFCEPQMHR